VGVLSKKPDKPAKMRALKVSLGAPAKRSAKGVGKAGKVKKPMSFSEWVEHYAKMSGGNPV
jgi:hypothetical protein